MNSETLDRYQSIRGDKHWTHRFPEKIPRGERAFARLHPERQLRGADLPQTKLLPEQVLQIRAQIAQGRGQKEIAEQFLVSRAAISAIAVGRTWKHLK